MISLQDFDSMSMKCQTLFLEGSFPINSMSSSKRGLVYGVGVNDADYRVKPKIDGKSVCCPAYHSWKLMLLRTYCAEYHKRQPTYSDVKICDEWHSFSAFRLWWLDHQVDGWQLDKDLVGDGKLYSPDTCVFVPSWVNSFASNCTAARGENPIGTAVVNGCIVARCRNPFTGHRESLGCFKSFSDASDAWRSRKIDFVYEMKSETDKIDKRIHDGLLNIIKGVI